MRPGFEQLSLKVLTWLVCNTICFQNRNLGLKFDRNNNDYVELDVSTLPRCLLTTSTTDCINGGATYLFWVKLLDPTTEGGIMTTLTFSPEREGLKIRTKSGNKLYVAKFKKGDLYTKFHHSVNDLVFNTWLQITVVWRNDPKLEIYFNNNLASDKAGSYFSNHHITDTEGKMVLGRWYTGSGGGYCSMIIDYINLYNRPLSTEEIGLVYETYD